VTSLSCWKMLDTSACSFFIASNDASGAVSSTAVSSPVSWRGRKPLGMKIYSATVRASVAPVRTSMKRWRFSAQSSVVA